MPKGFKVLFIYPNTMMATLVPINISLLSACLKARSFEVDLFDTTYYKTEDVSFEQKKVELLQIKPFNLSEKGIEFKKTDIYEDLIKKVSGFKPDLIGITIVENTYDMALELLNRISRFGIPVIAGGVFVTFSPEEVIANESIDMICVGEGEEALVELCEKMSSGEDHSAIENIWVKKDGKIIKNPMRPLIDVNKLPYIDYDVFGRERLYRPMFGRIYTMIHVEIDRGCPYDCTYCGASHLRRIYHENGCGVYYRRKDVPRIIAEMEHLVAKYDPDYVNFNSETFLAKPVAELKEFAGQYRKIGIPFWCQTRPETVTEEKIKILKDMKCESLQFGIEAGNEKFREKVLNRRCSNETMIRALKTVEKYDIPYTVNNMIGFPDETRELIFETIGMNRKISPRTTNCYLFTPYRGTSLRKLCVEKGYMDKDARVDQALDSTRLSMNSISYEELKGLQRTFCLYIKFPESEFDTIRKAEKFDEEGNSVFRRLSEEYREKFFR